MMLMELVMPFYLDDLGCEPEHGWLLLMTIIAVDLAVT